MVTFAEIRKQARKPGTKIYAIARVTYDDVICVQVTKCDFLRQIKGWKGKSEVMIIDESGDINIG